MTDEYTAKLIQALLKRVSKLEKRPHVKGDITARAAAMSQFLAIPKLRGAWTMATQDSNLDVPDISGNGLLLANNGPTAFGSVGYAPYGSVNGTTQWLSRAAEANLNIGGSMTVGGWYYFTSIAANASIISKYNASGNQRSFLMQVQTTEVIRFYVSGDGINNTHIASDIGSVVPGNWYFAVGRFTPSTEVAIFVNGVWVVNTTGVPTNIFTSTSPLSIGGTATAGSMVGRIGASFYSAQAMPDLIVEQMFEGTRQLYGV